MKFDKDDNRHAQTNFTKKSLTSQKASMLWKSEISFVAWSKCFRVGSSQGIMRGIKVMIS